MRSARSWVAVAAVLAFVSLAVSACGGDDAEGTEAAANAPRATGSPERLATRVAELMAKAEKKRDCSGLDAINARSTSKITCPVPKKVRRSMASFEVLDSAVFGTAAFIGYRSGRSKDGAVLLLYTNPARQWGVGRFGLLYEPDPRTSDEENRAGYDETLEGYLSGVRKRDCDLYYDNALTTAPNKRAACRDQFPATASLAAALKANPKAKPKYLGGNGDFGFYNLSLPKPSPQYLTISVVRTSEGSDQPFLVLDVVGGPSFAAR